MKSMVFLLTYFISACFPTLNNRRPPIETPEWTADDLIRLISKANRVFFYRPKQVLKLFPAIFNTIDLRRYIALLQKVTRKLG